MLFQHLVTWPVAFVPLLSDVYSQCFPVSPPPYAFFGRYSKVAWRPESARASNDKLYRFLAMVDYIRNYDTLNKI